MKKVFAAFAMFVGIFGAACAYGQGEESHYAGLDFVGPTLPSTFLATSGTGLTAAIYNDLGVWSTGYEHLKMFLSENGYSYVSISAAKILGGYLEQQQPDVLIMPGGSSWKYLEKLGINGASKIRAFIDAGGGYVGICAGAFYAVSLREGGHATGPYGIGLLEGTAYDGTALGTAPFKDGMLDFDMFGQNTPATQRMVLLGGPSFRYSDDEAGLKQVVRVANFQKINEPAMITFNFGAGRVFLAGPHLEVEENRTNWGSSRFDPESDWPLLDAMVKHVAER